MLPQARRRELIEKLADNTEANLTQNPDIFVDMFLSGVTLKGYHNMTDEELLQEHIEAFEQSWEHDPRNND